MIKKFDGKDVDSYIDCYPEDIQLVLNQVRKIIREKAPDAEECISYMMPAYKQNGILVYFAAQKEHLGFYPTPSGIVAFEDKLEEYEYSKGTIRFPYSKPLPVDLIREIVQFKIKENGEKAGSKSKK